MSPTNVEMSGLDTVADYAESQNFLTEMAGIKTLASLVDSWRYFLAHLSWAEFRQDMELLCDKGYDMWPYFISLVESGKWGIPQTSNRLVDESHQAAWVLALKYRRGPMERFLLKFFKK